MDPLGRRGRPHPLLRGRRAAPRGSASCTLRGEQLPRGWALTWRDLGGVEFGVLALHMRVTLGLARRAVDRSRPAAVLAARPSRRHDFSYW